MGTLPLLWLWLVPAGEAIPTRPVAQALETHAGAAACSEAGALAEQLELWTRTPTLDARLRIVVREDVNEATRARFELWSEDEQLVDRSLEPLPEDCDAYRASLALAIAFALDATVLQELGVPPAAEEEPPLVDPQLEQDEELSLQGEVTEEAQTEATALRGGLELGATGGLGLSPGASLGAGMNLRLDLHRNLSMELGGEFQQGFARALGQGEITMRFVVGRAALCGGGELQRVDLRACLSALGGATWIDGRGYEVEYQTRAPWFALGLGPKLRAPLSTRFSFVAALDAILPIAGVEAQVLDSAGGGEALSLRPPPVGGRVFMGVGVRFP